MVRISHDYLLLLLILRVRGEVDLFVLGLLLGEQLLQVDHLGLETVGALAAQLGEFGAVLKGLVGRGVRRVLRLDLLDLPLAVDGAFDAAN